MLREWGKIRTDLLTIEESPEPIPAAEQAPTHAPLITH
jgi:hypothetical protein